eukprot:TRINITY_DN23747_c0_g1_i1.p1 TRINITY_DN23747_c0_g1~~TRINITY_DN23747_c0_g1_i1.p1  ORF type:complete len:306 (+),score=92.13 TRINITY_DN23747_c0_g1_i1:49-918(+)
MAASAMLALALAGTNDFGQNFLSENKGKDGVVTLPSGLQYRVLREGDGDAHPLPDTTCDCHYEGRTAQEYVKGAKGKKFDSSYDRGSPTSFAPSGVIGGWTEAMQLMVAGDKWELFIPSGLGYGDSGQPPDIGPGDVLVFTMEILRVNGDSTPANRGPPPYATLESKADYDRWIGESDGGAGSVVGLFRQPTVGKLFAAFRSAARRLTKTGTARFALYAESRYDASTKQYTRSELEEVLKVRAPGVYVVGSGPKPTKCKTGHQQTSVTLDQVTEQLVKCTGAARVNDEL